MNEQTLAYLITLITCVAFLFLFWVAIVLFNKISNLLDKFLVKDKEIGLEEIFTETKEEDKDE